MYMIIPAGITVEQLQERLTAAQGNLSGLFPNITLQQDNSHFTGTIYVRGRIQGNFGAATVVAQDSPSFAGTVTINQGSFNGERGGVLQSSQIDRDQDTTLTIMRSVSVPVLSANVQTGTLKGNGELKLNGHTLTVVKALEEFTGKLVGPGGVRYGDETKVIAAEQTCEVREGVLQSFQNDRDQDTTLTIMRSVSVPVLSANVRTGTLKGNGELKLNGHTLTVMKALEEFTGKLVGPGEVRYGAETKVIATEQTCEVRAGLLQLSQTLGGSSRRLR
jgi:azurin